MHLRSKYMIADDEGFTLVELLIVVSMILIVGIISAPRIGDYMANADFRADARNLVGALKLARMEAVKRNENCSVTFTTDANGFALYTVYEDSNTNLILDGGEPVLLNGFFKNAVILAGNNGMAANANGDPAVTFNSRGLPLTDTGAFSAATVTLSGSYNRSRAQRSDRTTNIIYNRLGRIRIQ